MKNITISVLLLLCSLVAKADDISTIGDKYRQWILGSDQINYSQKQIGQRYEAILEYTAAANAKYDKFTFTPNDKFDFSSKKNQKEARMIFADLLFPLSLAYHLEGDPAQANPDYHNPETLEKILKLYSYLREKGWQEGLNMHYGKMDNYKETGVIGFGGSMGNNFLGYSISVFLNKDILAVRGMLDDELATLNWATNVVGPQYDFPVLWEVTGYNSDGVRAMFNNRLAYIMSLPEGENRVKEMLYFQRLFNKSLMVSDGFADLIKSDYMGYHHKNAYLSAYAPNAFQTAAITAYLLEGTEYQVSPLAISNLSNATLTTRIYSNKYDVPRGLAGRFPTKLSSLFRNTATFAYLAQLDQPLADELGGAFMRLWDPSLDPFVPYLAENVQCKIMYHGSIGAMELLTNFAKKDIAAEEAPQGYWYKPYGGLSIFRVGDAMVTWKGNSKYIWDFESGPKENRFGRYASSGALRIYADGSPVSAHGSGYLDEGWDWNRVPGGTTPEMPIDELPSRKTRTFTGEAFLGGVTTDGKSGFSAMFYDAPLSTVKAKKSVFFADDIMISLGSDIVADELYPVQTTLFQSAVTADHSSIKVDNKELKKIKKSISGQDSKAMTLEDPYGHLYYVPNAKNLEVELKNQNSINHVGKGANSGKFASARIIHGDEPQGDTYEYLVQIHGAKKAQNIANIAAQELYTVNQQDAAAHIVQYHPKNLTAYALFTPQTVSNSDLLKATDTPCLVMTETNADEVTLSVTNPDLGKVDGPVIYNKINSKAMWHAKSTVQPVQLTLKGSWIIPANEQATVLSHQDGTTTIQFDCYDGQAIVTKLTKK